MKHNPFVIAIIFCLFMACAVKDEKDHPIKTAEAEAIVIVDTTHGRSFRYSYEILEFEGHRYLTQGNGGIIHLASCKCMTQIKK